MRTAGLLSLLFVCSLLFPTFVAAELSTGGGHLGQNREYVPGEILVKFRSGKREGALQFFRQRRNVQALRSFPSIGVDHLRLPEELTVEEALLLFRSDPDVTYAEPNYYRFAAAVIPAGDIFSLLWGLHNTGQPVGGASGTVDADIDAPEAWEGTTGSGDVVVAVIDSGLDFSHPDLAGNVWSNHGELAGNGLDDDGNGYIDDLRGWDFISDDNAPLPNDASGHGTHVSGTIGASGGATTGMTGVSWQVRIMMLRTLNGYGAGDTADAILAFEYATMMGADIINCSWGGSGYSQALKDVIDATPALVVCAAGNSASDADTAPHYPAAYGSVNIVSVAATDSDDGLAEFSNFGSDSVDLGAPGVNIYSSIPGRRPLWSDDFDDGTIDEWTSGGPNNDWGVTASEAASPPWSLADSPDGPYSQRTNSWIRTPPLDLSGARNARFEFKILGNSESGYDTLMVEVSTDGSVWLRQPVKLSGIGIVNWVSGIIAKWTEAMVDLSFYDGQPTLYVRFSFITDWTNNYDGWYIDDVEVSASSSSYDGSEYDFKDGTSMAAPHVSGVAALVKGENPLLSAAAVKAILVGTVDPKPGLDGLLAGGGRLNAFGAVNGLVSTTVQFGAAAYSVDENGAGVTITVTRAGSSDGAVSVAYDVAGGTATEGVDYTETGGTLSWGDGESGARTFSLGIIDDFIPEKSETVEITLGTPTGGAAVAIPAKTVVEIFDNDYFTCPGDYNEDYDVDGSDLATFVRESAGVSLANFAVNFGKTACP